MMSINRKILVPFVVLIVLTSTLTSQTQQFFSFEENTPDTIEYFPSAIELTNGGYALATRKLTGDSVHCKFILLNEKGEKKAESSVVFGKRLLISALTETTFGILAFGTAGSRDSSYFISLLLNPSTLEVEEKHLFFLGETQESGVYFLKMDSFFVVSGTRTDSQNFFTAFISKVSFDGQIEKMNPNFTDGLITNPVLRAQDSAFLFLGYPSECYAADSNFNLLEVTKTPYRLMHEGGLLGVNDSTVLIVGKRKNIIFEPPFEDTRNIGIAVSTPFWKEKKLFQIGMSGDTIDAPAYNTSVVASPDGDVFVGGNANYFPGSWIVGNQRSWFMLTKLNKHTFAPLWTKFYGGDANYNLFGIHPTRDGGCILYGSKFSKWGTFDADAFLIKVGPDGLSQAPFPNHETPENIQVSPNPAADFLTIYPIPEKCRIVIYNLNGQALRHFSVENSASEQLRLPLDNLPAGFYLLSVSSEKATFATRFLKL